jgi:hypothetical protein
MCISIFVANFATVTHAFNLLLYQVVSAVDSDSDEPVQAASLPTGRKPKPNATVLTSKPAVNTGQDKPARAARPLTANSVRISHLPEFTQVNSKWKKIFIPSLYRTLFYSKAPFQDFVLGSSKFISIVQDVVNRVYPEVDYIIARDDPILLLVCIINSVSDSADDFDLSIRTPKAYNRINEKRSSLGADAVDIIAKHLQQLEYEPGDVKVWCRWAKRVDGPIFYEKPTPKTCTFAKNHKDYIVRGFYLFFC